MYQIRYLQVKMIQAVSAGFRHGFLSCVNGLTPRTRRSGLSELAQMPGMHRHVIYALRHLRIVKPRPVGLASTDGHIRRRRSNTVYIWRIYLHEAQFYAKTGSKTLSVDWQHAGSKIFKKHSVQRICAAVSRVVWCR